MAEYEWAWMNLCTRCFGYHHTPNDISMCPLIDMVNHSNFNENADFALVPSKLNRQMLDIEIEKRTEQEVALEEH
jgi:hypothetical protein